MKRIDTETLATLSRDAAGPSRALEIPAGTWHTAVALEPGTVLFEIKPGPYSPLAGNDFAAWAPAEGEAGTAELVQRAAQARVGESLA